VHAVLPRKVREPIRDAVKGPPPSAEQLAAQRQAEAERRQAEAAVKEERAKLGAERKAEKEERQAEKEAEERRRATQGDENERKSLAKAEASTAKPDKSQKTDGVIRTCRRTPTSETRASLRARPAGECLG
jgi:hypothetical protein